MATTSIDGGGLTAGLGLHMERRNLLWNLRADGIATSWSGEVDHYALVVGRANSDQSRSYRSLSGGLAFLHRVRCDGDCGIFQTAPNTIHVSNTIGLSVVGEWARRAGEKKGMGIGLTSFANLNPEASFLVVAVSVSAGRWR